MALESLAQSKSLNPLFIQHFIHKIIIQFFYKSKLNKNNKAETGIKSKNKLWTLWGWEVQKWKLEKNIYIFLLKIFLQKNDLSCQSPCDVVGCSIIGHITLHSTWALLKYYFLEWECFLEDKKPSKNKNIEPNLYFSGFYKKNAAHCFNEDISQIGI